MTQAESAADTRPECRWPGCPRQARPRAGDRGPQPLDCYQPDPQDGFRHDPTNWNRRRNPKVAGEPDPRDDQTPVATANRITGHTLDRLETLLASVREVTELLVAALETGSDPEAIAAQIDAELAEAREAQTRAEGVAARETLARRAAEDRATAAEAERDQLAVQTAFAEDDRTAAEAAADQARSERDTARSQLDEALQRIATLHSDIEDLRASEADARHAAQQAAGERDAVQQERDEARQRAQDLSDQVHTIDAQLREARADVGRLTGDLDSARTAWALADQVARQVQEEARVAAEHTAETVRQAQVRADAADAQHAAAERLVADRDQQITSLRADRDRLDAAHRQDLAERDRQIEDLRADLSAARSETTEARQAERRAHALVAQLGAQVQEFAGRTSLPVEGPDGAATPTPDAEGRATRRRRPKQDPTSPAD